MGKRSLGRKTCRIICLYSYAGEDQDTTLLTAINQLTHHGMVFVPHGYTLGKELNTMDEI